MSNNNHQVTWGGRFSKTPSDLMIRFSESVSYDYKLALFDIQCSQAHAAMLHHIGILKASEKNSIIEKLNHIAEEIKDNRFQWDTALEDVHMNIERALTDRLPVAAKLHTSRSRNDQVATDMRLYLKSACTFISNTIIDTMKGLAALAEKNKSVYIPGYTHLQRAQPVPIAHHLLAYVEMLYRDVSRFNIVLESANICPLGSGAIAGTTIPIDRAFVAKYLDFVDFEGNPQLTDNSMDAVADRDLFIEFLNACALCGTHLSRAAEDLILWSSAEFNFIRLPEAFTTGSSLMPQKKNPDSLELIRGKSARFQGHLQTMFSLVKGLPLTYNRDLQEDKIPVFDSFEQIVACLEVFHKTIEGIEVNQKVCQEAASDPLLLATDLVDYLVLKGVPFRNAHHKVGELVRLSEEQGVSLNKLTDQQAQFVDEHFEADWRTVFDLKTAMEKREQPGMPGPLQVEQRIQYWKEFLVCLLI